MEAQGSQLTNKYAEGYPGNEYDGGCEFVDIAENLAIDYARELFGAPTIDVAQQPGSRFLRPKRVFWRWLSRVTGF